MSERVLLDWEVEEAKRDAWRDQLKPGDPVQCHISDGYPGLTAGKLYVTVNGLEEGIFESRPYITVIDDRGKHATGHAYRFIEPTN